MLAQHSHSSPTTSMMSSLLLTEFFLTCEVSTATASESTSTMPIHAQYGLRHQPWTSAVDSSSTSFSWSDFPLIVHDEEYNSDVNGLFHASKTVTPMDCPGFPLHMTSTTSSTSSTSIPTKNMKKKRSVRFSPFVEIRTHSQILGDHPWCEGGLALELGWEYNSSSALLPEQIVRNVEKKDCQQSQFKIIGRSSSGESMTGTRIPHRRSYSERKRLLIEVGGYTSDELNLKDPRKEYCLVGRNCSDQNKNSTNGMTAVLQRQTHLSRVGSITESLCSVVAAGA